MAHWFRSHAPGCAIVAACCTAACFPALFRRRPSSQDGLLPAGSSQAAVLELLSDDVLGELLAACSAELEDIVGECASAVFEKI